MSHKEIVDRAAIAAIIENVDAAERKLRMIKQYVNPDNGTVRDTNTVAGLHHGAEDCMNNIRDLLLKFQ